MPPDNSSVTKEPNLADEIKTARKLVGDIKEILTRGNESTAEIGTKEIGTNLTESYILYMIEINSNLFLILESLRRIK